METYRRSARDGGASGSGATLEGGIGDWKLSLRHGKRSDGKAGRATSAETTATVGLRSPVRIGSLEITGVTLAWTRDPAKSKPWGSRFTASARLPLGGLGVAQWNVLDARGGGRKGVRTETLSFTSAPARGVRLAASQATTRTDGRPDAGRWNLVLDAAVDAGAAKITLHLGRTGWTGGGGRNRPLLSSERLTVATPLGSALRLSARFDRKRSGATASSSAAASLTLDAGKALGLGAENGNCQVTVDWNAATPGSGVSEQWRTWRLNYALDRGDDLTVSLRTSWCDRPTQRGGGVILQLTANSKF